MSKESIRQRTVPCLTKQLSQLGFWKYLFCIGMPSAFEWGSDDNYYRRPWEITADIYGGVQTRDHEDFDIAVGAGYLALSKMIGPLVWLLIK